MKIDVLAFASAGDILGDRARRMELPEGSRVADLRSRLEADFPALQELWPRLALAVDGELATDSTALSEGCEVALLPPVSGGSDEAADGRAGLTDQPIDPATAQAQVAGPTRGAVLLFLGTVRDHHQDRGVTRLDYSAYRPMALERLRRIVRELEAGGEDLRVAIVHRLGPVPPAEPSVVIACASPHRAAAYEASRVALERLKAEVPIWKKEHYADGEAAWREEEALVAGH